MTTSFNENLPSSEHESSSTVQRISRGTESKRNKTSRRISEEVGEELAKIEVSFSRGETLKGE